MGCDERRNMEKDEWGGERESKGGISLEAWAGDWPIPYPSFIVGESEDQGEIQKLPNDGTLELERTAWSTEQ